MKTLLATVGCIALMIASSLLNGYALSILWGWFMVPTLGLPVLSVVQAIGIAMVVSYLTHQHADEDSKKGFAERMVGAFVVALLRPMFALTFGYVVHLFA